MYESSSPYEDDALAVSSAVFVVAWTPLASFAEARITTAPRRRDDTEDAPRRGTTRAQGAAEQAMVSATMISTHAMARAS
jgi:hypothetical protein|tara:strand:- start:2118 stop:2357 length:240 start_codon:yes stop_codon:yes gene_type:complete